MENTPSPGQNFLTFLWIWGNNNIIALMLPKSGKVSEKYEDTHLILLSIISCNVLGDGLDVKFRQTLSLCSLRKHKAFPRYSCKNFLYQEDVHRALQTIKQCGCKLFGTSSTDERKWLTNSPGTALTATAKRSIFSNSIPWASHKVPIQNQRQSGLYSETNWQALLRVPDFHNRIQTGSLQYQIVIQWVHSQRQLMRYVYLHTFAFRKDRGGWDGQSTKTKWLYKTPHGEKTYRPGLTHLEMNTSPNHQPVLQLKTPCLTMKTVNIVYVHNFDPFILWSPKAPDKR